ncbi:MAG TPA: HypC/HybG/HupF family hydrogenase formation chaperone [Nitrospiria bacterium]|jgi:hydrogenase expression/formation protein HypC|nr:HypC/HybG/HupF family hydrogenase formation chaperone [Nitrospiria bacterium]
MCLAIPGQVLEIEDGIRPRMGRVRFGGIEKRVCLEWIPDATIGDYVIVHVGFAISKMNQEEAMKTLELFREAEGALEELKIPEPGEARGIPRAGEGGPDALRR